MADRRIWKQKDTGACFLTSKGNFWIQYATMSLPSLMMRKVSTTVKTLRKAGADGLESQLASSKKSIAACHAAVCWKLTTLCTRVLQLAIYRHEVIDTRLPLVVLMLSSLVLAFRIWPWEA